jgi:hypothetical protein
VRVSKILALLLCVWSVTCYGRPSPRQKKLSPLTATQLTEVVQKLKNTNYLNCAFIFDLKTTNNKKTESQEGKFYASQNVDGANLRFNFGNRSFLSLGKTKDQIFCSDKSTKMTLDAPLQSAHVLNFSDILMPFLGNKNYEYRTTRRVEGRDTHIIRFKESTGERVDIAYDPKFEVILQVEHFDKNEKLIRTFKLLNFKKTQNIWLMKSIEIKDVIHSITSRLTIKRVAVKQIIPAILFDENSLDKSLTDNLVYVDF